MVEPDKEAIRKANNAKKLIFGKKKKRKKSNKYDRILLGFSILLIILAAVITFSGEKEKSFDTRVAATINGENILLENLEKEYTKLPPEIKLGMTKEDLLEQMIDRKLLLQEAEKKGITVSYKEFTTVLNNMKRQFGTEFQFNSFLKEQNTTILEFQNDLREQLRISKFLEGILRVTVNEEEINKFFLENRVEDVTLNESRETITKFLTLEKQRELYESYVDELRRDSEIENYLETDGLKYASVSSLGECLKNNRVKIYGADWCQHTQKQKEILGNAFEYLTYVECETESRESTGNCEDIDFYPTWEIDGEKIVGILSIKDITKLTGCKNK